MDRANLIFRAKILLFCIRSVFKHTLLLLPLSFMFVGGLFFSFEAHASQPAQPPVERGYVPLAPLPLPGMQAGEPVSPGAFLSGVYQIGVSLAILLAVIMIMYAGIKYIVTSSSQSKGAARDIIEKALIGLLLAVGGYSLFFLIGGEEAVEVRFDLPDIRHVEEPADMREIVCSARIYGRAPVVHVVPDIPRCGNIFGRFQPPLVLQARSIEITRSQLYHIRRGNITQCYRPRPLLERVPYVPGDTFRIDISTCPRQTEPRQR